MRRHIPPYSALAALVVALLAAPACSDSPTPPETVHVVEPAGGGQTGTAGEALAQPLAARVVDGQGRPLAGVPVSWVVVSGGGEVSAAAPATDAEGRATAFWTLGPAAGGGHQVELRVEGAEPLVFTATARAGAGEELAPVAGGGQSGPSGERLPDSLAVRVTDRHGNPVAGQTVRWAVQSGGGSVSPDSTATGPAGVARTAWTLGVQGGQHRVVASAGERTAVFTATPTGITFTVVEPAPNTPWGDTLRVRVADVQSPAPVVEMSASVEGRSVTLPGVGVAAKIPLAGLPRGTLQVRVRVRSAGGDSAVALVPFRHNAPPRLVLTAPRSGTVVRDNRLRVDAECQDDDPAGCASIVVTWFSGVELAHSSGGSLHAEIPVPHVDGYVGAIGVQVTARDSEGQTHTSDLREIYVESTPRWVEVASQGVRIWDADAGRIVYDSVPGLTRLRTRATGADSVVQSGRPLREAFLHPAGVVYRDAVSLPFDWRAGTTVSLGHSVDFIWVRGRWAAWEMGLRQTVLRDLLTGTQITRHEAQPRDLAANGDLLFVSGSRLYRLRGGVADSLDVHSTPAYTDGTNVVFRNSFTFRLYLLTPDGTRTELAELAPHAAEGRAAALNNGWVAFLRPDAAGQFFLWVRTPAGVERPVNGGGGGAALESVGPQRQVLFSRGGRWYLSLPDHAAPPLDVGNGFARMEWMGNELYAFLGRTMFRVQF